jgi:hypothetical protein
MTQHQKNEEKKRKFEEDIIEVAVAEYYQYADVHKRERKEKDAEMFYTAMRIGVIRGLNFATNQYMQSLKNFEKGQADANGNKSTDKTSETIFKTSEGEK